MAYEEFRKEDLKMLDVKMLATLFRNRIPFSSVGDRVCFFHRYTTRSINTSVCSLIKRWDKRTMVDI